MRANVGRPHLVGRTHELDILKALVEGGRRGPARLALVQGEAGIGKTRLIEGLLPVLERAGFRTYAAAGEELERGRPFGLLADALAIDRRSNDPERVRLANLINDPNEGRDVRFHVSDGICDLIERDAAEGPVAVIAEDVHWADPSTVTALHRLIRRGESLPLLIVLTSRPLPNATGLDRLLRELDEAGAVWLALEPLTAEETVELATVLLDARPGPVLAGMLPATAGNPLFVTELLASAEREGLLERREGIVEASRPIEPSPSLRLTILRRMSFLAPETLGAMRVASVLGESFSIEDLSAVADRSSQEMIAAMSEAIDAGFVRDVGGRLAFRHDLVRDALYGEHPEALRRSLHRQAGRALVDAGAPAHRVAFHLALAAEPGDPDAIAWLLRAGRELASRSPSTAVEMLERALSLDPTDEATKTQVLGALILPLVWTGHMDDADRRAREVMASASTPATQFEVRRALAAMFYLRHRWAEMERLASETLAMPELNDASRIQFEVIKSMVTLATSGDLNHILKVADELLELGHRAGSAPALCSGHIYTSIAERCRGYLLRAIRPAEEAVQAAKIGVGNPAVLSSPEQVLGNMYAFGAAAFDAADRLSEAENLVRSSLEWYERVGALAYATLSHRFTATVLFHQGRWDDALAEIEAARQLTSETGTAGLRSYAADAACLIAVHRGDMREAREAVDEITSSFPDERPVLAELWVLPTLGVYLEAIGESQRALETFASALRVASEMGAVLDYRMFARPAMAAALAAEDRALAEEIADGAEEFARRSEGLPTTQGIALLCKGMLDADAEALLAAVEAYRKGPRRLELASACDEAGMALGRRGKSVDAIAVLKEAAAIYETIGAGRDAARVAASLRGLGARAGSKQPRKRATHGWESLTKSEHRVIELMVEGLSNPEIGKRLFVSRRTVASHLSSAFRKLGVASRTELAARAARRQR